MELSDVYVSKIAKTMINLPYDKVFTIAEEWNPVNKDYFIEAVKRYIDSDPLRQVELSSDGCRIRKLKF